MIEELSRVHKVAGVKQSLRALREGKAERVFLAIDADPLLLERVRSACGQVPAEQSCTMAQLGEAAGIAVGAAVITVLKG